MLYFTKKGMVQLLEDVSAVEVFALGKAKSLVKFFTKTMRQLKGVQKMGVECGLIQSHCMDLAPSL